MASFTLSKESNKSSYSGKAKFNLPKSDYSPAKNKIYTVSGIDLQTFSLKNARGKYKAFDFSTYYNSDSPYKKFHQLTMYLHGVGPSGVTVLTANLPEQIQYTVGSKWGDPIKFDTSGIVNMAFQSLSKSNSSSVLRATTAQIWNGPEPLQLQFTIKVFDETSTDSVNNFQECLRDLGAVCLPTVESSAVSMYKNVPAGANLSVGFKTNDLNATMGSATGPYISLLIGGMLYVKKLVMKQFTVNYNSNKAMILHEWPTANGQDSRGRGQRLLPMTAEISFQLQTVEGLDRGSYTSMLMMNHGNDNNQLTGNMSMVADLTTDTDPNASTPATRQNTEWK